MRLNQSTLIELADSHIHQVIDAPVDLDRSATNAGGAAR